MHSSFSEDSYLYNEEHQRSNVSHIDVMPHGRLINSEFSLQSASQNSREIIQQQSGSQIREF